MTALNREACRDEIATGLNTALVGSGKPATAVYNYQKSKLAGASPVVFVLSGGIARRYSGMGSQKYDNRVQVEVHLMVMDARAGEAVTDQDVEDRLDLLEQSVAEWVRSHQTGTHYQALKYTGEFSKPLPITHLDGNPYLLEVVILEMEAKDA